MAGGGLATPVETPVQRGNPMTTGGPGRSYFQERPDVGFAYSQDSQGLSPTDFAQKHFNQFGQFEGAYNPSQQFYQPVYQPQYQDYNMGNRMGVSQYGQGFGGFNPYMMQMQTPFNPYTNSFGFGGFGGFGMQTPFSQPQPMQPNYGPAQPIVSRSAAVRGTPNVMMRRAEGGIASLVDE